MTTHNALKILQVLPSLVSGGVERGTLDLCQHLINKGHEAWVVSSGGPLVKLLEGMGAHHIELNVHSKNPIEIWRNSRRLSILLKDKQFDLIHARSRAPAWSCFWASRKASIPFITTFHGQYGHQNRFKLIYNSVMLKSHTCIAVSKFIETHIKMVYPPYPAKIKLIHRGIDLDTFSQTQLSQKNATALAKKWHIEKNTKLIILPGRLTRLKGHRVFLEAVSQLKDLNDVRFLIVGDEPGKTHYKNELEELIAKYKLSALVKLTGNCDDMPAMYQLANVVISASTKPESFGRVACEAQAMGCLVIATNHGGSLETISPLQTAFMCEVNDSTSMVRAIRKALSYFDPENQKARRMIEDTSRDFIEENFSLKKMCDDTIALYQEVVSNT